MTSNQLSTLGEKYDRKSAKMLGVSFQTADNIWVDKLPGITLASDGLVSTIDMREHNKWIGFSIRDSNGKQFQFCFASKDIFGEVLAAMKSGTKLNLIGRVVELEHAGWYGLVCTKIEVVKDELGN